MGEDGLRYDAMVESALRGVVRRALAYAAERGLPGDHHFYISFRTTHPGVDIPAALRARYPEEMTIVLQHQFWGLDVGEEAFGVTLSFSDVPERLTIPFAAVSAFADPSVRFGLQFDASKSRESGAMTPMAASEQRQKPLPQAVFSRVAARPEDTAGPAGGTDGEGGPDANVIRFQPRRKK